MAWAYILRCSDGSYYVGSTTDLERRVWEHEQGLLCAYTRRRRPVELIWSHEFERIDEAWGWERRIHGWSRAKKEALMEGRYDDLPALAWGYRSGVRGERSRVPEQGTSASD